MVTCVATEWKLGQEMCTKCHCVVRFPARCLQRRSAVAKSALVRTQVCSLPVHSLIADFTLPYEFRYSTNAIALANRSAARELPLRIGLICFDANIWSKDRCDVCESSLIDFKIKWAQKFASMWSKRAAVDA